MVLNFFGKTPSQCAEVNYALGINYACGNSTFNWNSNANQLTTPAPSLAFLNAGVLAPRRWVCCRNRTQLHRINAKRPTFCYGNGLVVAVILSWSGVIAVTISTLTTHGRATVLTAALIPAQ